MARRRLHGQLLLRPTSTDRRGVAVTAILTAGCVLFACNAITGREGAVGLLGPDASGGTAEDGSVAEAPDGSSSRDAGSDAEAVVDGDAPPGDAVSDAAAGPAIFATIDPPTSLVMDMVSDGAEVFWTTVDSCSSATKVTLHAKSVGATSSDPGRVVADLATSGGACGFGTCFRVALSGQDVGVTVSSDSDGVVRTFGKDGTPRPILASGEPTPCALGFLVGRPIWSAVTATTTRTIDADGRAVEAVPHVAFADFVTDGTDLFGFGRDYDVHRTVIDRFVATDHLPERYRVFSDNFTQTGGLAVSANHLFFALPTSGMIRMIPKGGGTSVLVADGIGKPQRLAWGDPFLYFVSWGPNDRGNGLVGKIRIGAASPVGPVEPLATGLELPEHVALDDRHVYWFDSSVHAILRVRR